jgi:hypothetical protein
MLTIDNVSVVSLFNFVQKKENVFIKKTLLSNLTTTIIKDLRFKNYINMLKNTHLLNDTKIELCYDTSSDSSLVFIDIVIFYYSNLSIYQIRDDQKIRCQDVETKRLKSDICIELSIRILIIEDQYVILKREFHIMSQLSCNIIIEIDIMKSFDIVFV